ncbi:MAG: T9SS type A sorting domain-containing protein [Sphingobacteriales bacterium]|nr:MAG: T9SS type A sorting domain-containing protein [Sphingobacteriales bacterium]
MNNFINKIKLKAIIALAASIFCASEAKAAYATAAAYPFKATSTNYNYLVGGTPITSWNYSWAYGYVYSSIPIGFTFNFAGTDYTSLWPSTKGYFSFNNPNTYWYAPNYNYYWNALGTAGGGVFAGWGEGSGMDATTSPCTYKTEGVAPNRVFILEYKNWGTVNYTSGFISYQYRLYEQGAIEIVYQREAGTGRFGTYSYGTIQCAIGILKTGTDFQTLNNASSTPTPNSTTFVNNINATPATGQSYLWGEIPCATINTSVDGPTPICKNKTFTLNLTNNLHIYSGLTYQWQSSINNSSWTNVTGATTYSLSDAITSPKYYRAVVTCSGSGQVFTTASKFIDTANFYLCYCEGSTATTPNSPTDIGNVQVITYPKGDTLLNNGNRIPTFSNSSANKFYSDFRRELTPIPMYGDSSYRIRLSQVSTNTTLPSARAAVYIDYNRNRSFEPRERILLESTSITPPFPGMVTDTFKLPMNIDSTHWYGITGMRVILVTGATDPDTCMSYLDGETEDYLVDLRFPPCNGAPSAGAIEGDTSMCIGYDYFLTDSTYQKKTYGLSRIWEESGDNVTWNEIPTSVNKDTIIRVFSGQPVYYRVKIKCSQTGDSTYTTVHKVNVKPSYKCYCHSQSIGGAEDSSDVGGFTLADFAYNYGGSHLGNPRSWHKRQDFTDWKEIVMFVDSVYDFSVFHTQINRTHGDAKVTVFVDFNNNKQYDIPEERIYTGFTTVGNFNMMGQVIMPNTVITDVPTGMRVIVNNDVAPNVQSDSACGEYASGETEDYIVKFVRRFPATVNDVITLNNVSMYPNPTSGKFTIGFNNNKAGEVKIRVSNVTGQQLLSEVYKEQAGSHSLELDLGGRARGVYFVELEANGIKTTRRLVLQ